ncbi:patatin-like phospholipase family protein [Steroidobacter sp. S1-65]|uniref:Patatin-like phospholipase family protein n=1 Tax=Steroidobacter gossypii TaxID=2805490 RepID=A0ABS1WSB5_9GAMM|nr:patatin-like phospholipase family protein [Steroidobacter gossypii]MBM0103876.1 patatin-like phospholipase family protein [Steroidobacter gossypii]
MPQRGNPRGDQRADQNVEQNSDQNRAERATFNQVLWTELQALRPDYCASQPFQPAKFEPQRPDDAGTDPQYQDNLRELFQMIGTFGSDAEGGKSQPPLSALCLSGGGIRSATFNLGVLQALAKNKLLPQFDYLSSVSGGGYIAGWLQAWMHREQQQAGTAKDVFKELGNRSEQPVNPLAPEPKPLDHLRQFSNYLTPRLGLFSGDTWTAAATILRNLLLNWLVILPLLAALVVIPQGVYLLVQSTVSPGFGRMLMYASLLAELLASFSIYYHRRFVRDPGTPSSRYAVLCVLPVIAAAALLSFTGLGYANGPAVVLDAPFWSAGNRPILMFSAVWCLLVPLSGWMAVEIVYRLRHQIAPETRHTEKFELAALLISGLAVALLFAVTVRELLLPFYAHPGLYVMLTLPVLLGLYLLARTLFVGLASMSETFATGSKPALVNDGDREWWARLSGWILAVALGWIALTGLCVFGQFLLDKIMDEAKPLVAAAGGISGVIAALLGSRDKTATSAKEEPSIMQRVGLALAAPVFVVCVVLAISWATAGLGGWMVTNANVAAERIFTDPMLRHSGLRNTGFEWFWALPWLLLLAALTMGLVVNVNRFSLHGFYRNRLVRAYLGASHTDRKPDPFTGFDASDNLRMHKLKPDRGAQRLLPLINVTLNLLRDGKLAWQERKAESFSITPYFCGNFHEGYRASAAYGGQGGISLGTAVTISGAAANPHMGYCSSPALAFVMSLFNVRLGAWLGNTNARGEQVYDLPGPRQALSPMLGELFGYTTPDFKYVNLSDGGHFDNLGLYEVVLRRCRYIMVSDAGCDPDAKLGDLGNAIRKIRIDFGIPIRFEKEIEIYPNSSAERGLYCATARIDYDAVDKGTPPGRLLYIKPTLRGRGEHPIPYDVYSYSRTVDAFPHEPTTDQWFSESQFESYRALGFHALEQILQGSAPQDFADFFARVATYLSPKGKLD